MKSFRTDVLRIAIGLAIGLAIELSAFSEEEGFPSVSGDWDCEACGPDCASCRDCGPGLLLQLSSSTAGATVLAIFGRASLFQ